MNPHVSNLLKRVGQSVVVLCVALTTVVLVSPPAFANHQSLAIIGGTNVDDVPTFGPNEVIEFIGGFHPTFDCPDESNNDPRLPTLVRADVYVNGELAATVEALGGLTLGTQLGITQPSGTLGSGTYSVTFDECQDGPGGPDDVTFDRAFRVELPASLPPIDPLIVKLKEDAAKEAAQISRMRPAVAGGLAALNFTRGFRCGLNPGATCRPFISPVFGGYLALFSLSDVLPDPQQEALKSLRNLQKVYEGIADDPPDDNFRRATQLAPLELQEDHTTDPLLASVVDMANTTSQEVVLARALLAAIERYQGADLAGNAEWGLRHARDIQAFAESLALQLERVNDAYMSLDEALTQDQSVIEQGLEQFRQLASQVQAGGLTDEQRRGLLNTGISTREINTFEQSLRTGDFVFQLSELQTGLRERIQLNQSLAADLLELSNAIEPMIMEIQANPDVNFSLPVADAGGPYSANQGNVLLLDGSGSRPASGRTIRLYQWDLDRDGDFDDAEGPSPTFVYERSFESFVGLRVTDSSGETDIDYAPVDIGGVNRRPAISASSPEEGIVEVAVGTPVEFSVTVEDPDSDVVEIEWFVNGEAEQNGTDFSFTPNERTGLATDVVRVVASDGESFSALEWVVIAVHSDSDDDGFLSNVDCDDDNPSINPGAAEILGNNVDDDCDGAIDVAGAQNSRILGGQLFSAGGQVEVEVLPATAGYDSELWLFEPGPERMLATNRDVGTIVELGSFPEGVELVFGIRSPEGEFRMGPGSRNPDDLPHAVVEPIDDGRVRVGFEDLFGGGDQDYDDNVFEFRGAISPIPTSQAPQATADTFETERDTALEIPASALLQNDSDPEGGPLEVIQVDASPTTEGSVSLSQDTVTYAPTFDTVGSDQFTYTIADQQGATDEATVTISIAEPNRNPLAANFVQSTSENAPLAIHLSATDPDDDVLSFEIAAGPEHGSLSVLQGDDVTYTPDDGYVGPDLFTYLVTDEHGATDTGTVGITVTEVGEENRPPTATDLNLSTPEDTPLSITLAGTDPDGDDLTFEVATGPEHGSLSVLQGDDVTYTPDDGYVGPDLFTYLVTDEHGATDNGTVTITVNEAGEALDCTSASPLSDILWPPDHKFHTIQIIGIGTPEDRVTITIDSIFQDESPDDEGDGNFSPDGMGVGASSAQIRAERSGTGDGRVYHIEFSAERGTGESCIGEVEVSVPHSPNKPAVDGGPLFDSTAS